MVVVKLIFLRTLYNWMATMGGLANDDNYHAFCHLLGHFKGNYQVTLTICSLNRCIQLLLLCLMSSVWLNCILLIGTKSIFKRHTEFAFIFLPSLLCFKMADRRGSRKTSLSLNNHHYCLLQDLSAPPSTLSTMMVFPNLRDH